MPGASQGMFGKYEGGNASVVGIWEGIHIANVCPMYIFCGPV